MGKFFYLIGLVLAGYAGYSNLQWYFIFISSAIMTIGYLVIRAPQIQSLVVHDGVIATIKLLSILVIMYLIITTPVYFIAAFFN